MIAADATAAVVEMVSMADAADEIVPLETCSPVPAAFADGIVRERDRNPFLGFQTDADIRIKLILLSDFGVPVNDYVRMKLAVFTECDVLTNDAKRANFTTRADFGFWMNNRRFVNHENMFVSI